MVSGPHYGGMSNLQTLPDLKAFLHIQTILLRIWKVVSFVLDGSRVRRGLCSLREKCLFVEV
jgi:hypothetical protein